MLPLNDRPNIHHIHTFTFPIPRLSRLSRPASPSLSTSFSSAFLPYLSEAGRSSSSRSLTLFHRTAQPPHKLTHAPLCAQTEGFYPFGSLFLPAHISERSTPEMIANAEKQNSNVATNGSQRVLPGATKKRLPWLDGRSSISSTPLVSPPGNASPRRRLSIVHAEQPDAGMETRLRTDSLAPVPNHLERFDTPDSLVRSVQRNIYASPPQIIQTVQKSPSQPVPRPSVFERHSHRKLSNAIEGLEELVEDAVITAEHAEQPEYLEKIYEIIEDASVAVHDASTRPTQDLTRVLSPLKASAEEVNRFSSEFHGQPEVQIERIAEHVTPSPLQDAGQRIPETIDWAYRKAEGLDHQEIRSLSSSSTSSTSSSPRGRRHARFSSSSDRLQLLPPEPIATTARDHVNHVLRPRVSRSRSRGRPRQRRSSDNHHRRRHRHRRSWRSAETGSQSSHRQQRSFDSSNSGLSLDEEDFHGARKPTGNRRYGEELHVRDAHRHTFSLRRNHRRKPVARNWRTGKKRICALIACANTAVLGIIIGIYVSTCCHDQSALPSLMIPRLEKCRVFSTS